MKKFGWRIRFQYAAAAGIVGWIAGFLLTIPFEIALTARYLEGQARGFPITLAEGLTVWACFTLFMAAAAWGPLVLPLALLVPPAWAVRWRGILALAGSAAAVLAMGKRLNLFHKKHFVDLPTIEYTFFTSHIVFAFVFAIVLTVTYSLLAERRLRPDFSSNG
jgi:hypothetical protein